MNIRIEEINNQNQTDLNKTDNKFIVHSILEPVKTSDELTYKINKLDNPFEKFYPNEDINVKDYIDSSNKTIFFAYVDNDLAGQIVLKKSWNNYAYIDDLRVNPKFRKNGIGKKLIENAVNWAHVHHLPGINLETQNTNVDACKFYQKCGFILGGFDYFLYNALDHPLNEVALYWYLLFKISV